MLASMCASSRFLFILIRRLLLDLLFIIILLNVIFLWFWWFRWLRSWFHRWSALSSPVVGFPPFTWSIVRTSRATDWLFWSR